MLSNDLINYTQDLNILYVEDEKNLREDITSILSHFFKTVISAEDGEEAFALYLKHTSDEKDYFDIVFTDIYMPKIDGIELIEKIYEKNKDQVVVVVSAHNESDKLMDLIHLGITNFIQKPFSRQAFQDIFLKVTKDIVYEKEKVQFIIDKQLYEHKKVLLEDKEESLKELIDNISHHWRQPLSLISTIASGIQLDQEINKIDIEKNDKLLQKIIDATMDMSDTIDTLAHSIQSDEYKQFFDIKDTFETVKFLMHSKFINQNITLKESVQSIEIEQIEQHIQQIFIHIFNNAIDAMVKNPVKFLFVNIFQEDNKLHIEIKDNGAGLLPSTEDKLYDPYFTTKHKYHGTGLGLFVVKDLVRNDMKGSIDIQNVQYEYEQKEYGGVVVNIIIPL